jgi:hypothetical protein
LVRWVTLFCEKCGVKTKHTLAWDAKKPMFGEKYHIATCAAVGGRENTSSDCTNETVVLD